MTLETLTSLDRAVFSSLYFAFSIISPKDKKVWRHERDRHKHHKTASISAGAGVMLGRGRQGEERDRERDCARLGPFKRVSETHCCWSADLAAIFVKMRRILGERNQNNNNAVAALKVCFARIYCSNYLLITLIKAASPVFEEWKAVHEVNRADIVRNK